LVDCSEGTDHWSGAEVIVFCVAIDGPISIENTEMIGCSGIECKWVHFELQEPIKVFNGTIRSHLSKMDSLVVWSGAEDVAFVCRNGHTHFNRKGPYDPIKVFNGRIRSYLSNMALVSINFVCFLLLLVVSMVMYCFDCFGYIRKLLAITTSRCFGANIPKARGLLVSKFEIFLRGRHLFVCIFATCFCPGHALSIRWMIMNH